VTVRVRAFWISWRRLIWVWWLSCDKGAEKRGFGKLECIVGDRNDFVFDAFLNLKPVE
jgi:hypothetical protein